MVAITPAQYFRSMFRWRNSNREFGLQIEQSQIFEVNMDSDFELALVSAAVVVIQEKRRKSKKRRSMWSRQWLLRRQKLGLCDNLLIELTSEDPAAYKNWMRMDEETFLDLLKNVELLITKKDTKFREAISASHRLAVTLRYLATGESQTSMAYTFRIAQNTISGIIQDTSKAIYEVLKSEFLNTPSQVSNWQQVVDDFWKHWQFLNCIGALDGKHINITPPPGTGTEFYNYKSFFSIVLMALVDASYRFIYVDIGTNGRISDGGVFAKSALKQQLENCQLGIPGPQNLPYSEIKTPLVIVADDAFGLKSYLMRPYPGCQLTREQRIYNYRLSRARRVSENAFGILANRWRFLLNKIQQSPEKVENLVLASICLHNYLCTKSSKDYIPDNLADRENSNGEIIPGAWRQDISNGTYTRPLFSGHRASIEAKKIQDDFKRFLSQEGSVPWQNASIQMH